MKENLTPLRQKWLVNEFEDETAYHQRKRKIHRLMDKAEEGDHRATTIFIMFLVLIGCAIPIGIVVIFADWLDSNPLYGLIASAVVCSVVLGWKWVIRALNALK